MYIVEVLPVDMVGCTVIFFHWFNSMNRVNYVTVCYLILLTVYVTDLYLCVYTINCVTCEVTDGLVTGDGLYDGLTGGQLTGTGPWRPLTA